MLILKNTDNTRGNQTKDQERSRIFEFGNRELISTSHERIFVLSKPTKKSDLIVQCLISDSPDDYFL